MSKKISVPSDCLPMCKTCAFFVSDKKNDIGECHRFPPKLLTGEEGVSFSFALCADSDWCGEYVRFVS